jgi:hypothetical protein
MWVHNPSPAQKHQIISVARGGTTGSGNSKLTCSITDMHIDQLPSYVGINFGGNWHHELDLS